MTKRFGLLRVLLTGHLLFTAVLWAIFMLVVLAIAGIVAANSDVTESVLSQAASLTGPWIFGMGLDMVNTYLRTHLAHGRTRREFAGQVIGCAIVLSGFASLLITLGYLLERGVYAIFGWPQRLAEGSTMFSTPDQYPEIMGTYWLVLLMWTVTGLVIGLAFFRSTGLGLLMIPIGLAIVLPSATATHTGGVLLNTFEGLGTPAGLVTACTVLFVFGVGLIWVLVRDVPMKAKAP